MSLIPENNLDVQQAVAFLFFFLFTGTGTLCIKIGGVDAKGFFEFGLGSTICF
jgi:hypothetical protein